MKVTPKKNSVKKKEPVAEPPSIKNLRIDSNPNTEENSSSVTEQAHKLS